VSFRIRVLMAFLPVALVPLLVFGFGSRAVVRERLTEQYQRRVEALANDIRDDLRRRSADVDRRLEALRDEAVEDNRLRRGLLGVRAERFYVLDYADGAMRLAGLDMLQLQTDRGRVMSSGHFRNEYDRFTPALHLMLPSVPGPMVLVRARAPEGPFLALVRARTFRVGDQTLGLSGGTIIDGDFIATLAPEPDLRVTLITPHDTLSSRGADTTAERVVAEVTIPYIDAAEFGGLGPARIVVSHSLGALATWQTALDTWFRGAVIVTVVIAALLGLWVSFAVSRPIARLARRTAAIDFDRMDAEFPDRRRDEIGALGRVLNAMMARLRTGTGRLREMERRATIGELAQQVNHDVKNGLAPLRQFFRHLWKVAKDQPGELPRVVEERREAVESGLGYLEGLAANYAKLTARNGAGPCDVNAVVKDTVDTAPVPEQARVDHHLGPNVPAVRADPIALRRIVENLVRNGLESLDDGAGVVSVSTELVPGENEVPPGVRITVVDTGKGMSDAERDRAFEAFYSTKPGGSGLGLTIVRRLVLDLGGQVRIETPNGPGTSVVVELPGLRDAA
jgi:signal transduction histidine kinase